MKYAGLGLVSEGRWEQSSLTLRAAGQTRVGIHFQKNVRNSFSNWLVRSEVAQGPLVECNVLELGERGSGRCTPLGTADK